MNRKLLQDFRNPGSPYRGVPLWAWNGKLDPEELRRQIRLMHRAGLGGFFMHSRVGLATPYLSKEWMECVAACVAEAEALDMKAWLYDEDRWPSGAAGGLVTRHEAYRMRSLRMESFVRAADFEWQRNTIAAFTARIEESNATQVQRLARRKRPAALEKDERILAFSVHVQPCSSWYNGQAYLDTMNPAAVRAFIKNTHEAYRGRFRKTFGERIPGIFTDEPNYGHTTDDSLPWTDGLPAAFRRRFRYDVLDRLVEIFYTVDGAVVSPARRDYHDCVTFLFVDAFSRQIGEWCSKNSLQHTGHALEEPTLDSQTRVTGSCMRFYEYMQAPGMDLLTEHNREYDTAKQVSSVARQFGRQWRLTETYGCTGWDFPLAGHKALGDWQAALGINLRAQHLAWYTMEGQAKRDYPAAIFYQSPWWDSYRKVEDYFARVNMLMSRGEEVRDILVVHPLESVWTCWARGCEEKRKRLDTMFWKFRDSLLADNFDFDYGDEDILARHGRVVSQGQRPILTVNKARYRIALVPPLLTIRRTTIELLRKFWKMGGTVIFAGDVPAYVDAEPAPDAKDLAAFCQTVPAEGAGLTAALESGARRVSIADPKGNQIRPALHCLREDRDAWYLFVCNTGHDAFGTDPGDVPVAERTRAFPDVGIRVSVNTDGHPLEADPGNGSVETVDAMKTRSGWEIRTSLPALGSRIFVFPKRKHAGLYPAATVLKNVRTQALRQVRWDARLSEPNCLVLDRPKYRIEGGSWRGPEEVLCVDHAVRDALGVQRRGGRMVQPWARKAPEEPKSAPVQLRYSFQVKTLPSGGLWLAVEQPKTFQIAVNGHPLNLDAECGWWVDRSLRKLPVDPAVLRVGENTLELACDYTERHPGLEIVYLLGNFGVDAQDTELTVTDPPLKLKTGDWVPQGLPFYGGNVSYIKTIRPKLAHGERLFLAIPEYKGAAVRVLVNGAEAGIIAWEPNEVELTDHLNGPEAVVTIEILGHRRNSHGPLHLGEKWPSWTGPGSFEKQAGNWIDGYQLVPCGLMAPPKLIVREKA